MIIPPVNVNPVPLLVFETISFHIITSLVITFIISTRNTSFSQILNIIL